MCLSSRTSLRESIVVVFSSPPRRYLARLYLSESLLAMNQIDLALEQLDGDMIKNESDLSFKMSMPTVEKGLRNPSINRKNDVLGFCRGEIRYTGKYTTDSER